MIIDTAKSQTYGRKLFVGWISFQFHGVTIQDTLMPGYINIVTLRSSRINRKSVIHVGFTIRLFVISQTIGIALTLEPLT